VEASSVLRDTFLVTASFVADSVLDANSTKTGFSAAFSVDLESLVTAFVLDSVVLTGAESLATVFEFDPVVDSGLFEVDSTLFNAGFSIDSIFFSASFFGSYRVMSPLISAFFGYR
jgi:hypothetical protein